MTDRSTDELPAPALDPTEALATSRRPSHGPMADVSRVSKASHVPLYYQLAVILENRVEAGDYEPWQRFPSEHELCEEFDVSRAVVRPAIAILEREGRLERVKGKGTFVRPPKALHKLGGLSRVLADHHPPGTTLEVIEIRSEASNPEVAQVLAPPLRRITALLRTGGEPRALFWTFLSDDVHWADDLSEGPPVPIDQFESDLLLAEGDCVIESSWSTDFESSCLEIPGGTPILVAHCTEVAHFSKAPELRNVEVAWVICRADAMRVRAKLGAAPARPS